MAYFYGICRAYLITIHESLIGDVRMKDNQGIMGMFSPVRHRRWITMIINNQNGGDG